MKPSLVGCAAPRVHRTLVAQCVALLVLIGSCSSAPRPVSPKPRRTPIFGKADIDGYSLSFECEGSGSPTVILDAGYAASGTDTYSETILPALANITHVCTYDRAGDGLSDPRPASVTPLTGGTQAAELHALVAAIHVAPPYVLVGHSYGGIVSREFAAAYPTEVAGLVLIDASSEPEIPVYDRLHAGPWDDGTDPSSNMRIDIHATVDELRHAPSLAATPLVVITAGILQDRWLKTVPRLEAAAQTRLADLSSDSIHVVDRGVGHLIPDEDPPIVIDAVDATIDAARTNQGLAPCAAVFSDVASARCLTRGTLGRQIVP